MTDTPIATVMWVQRCINSCNTIDQLNNAKRLIGLYYKRTSNLFFRSYLQDKWEQQRKYLTNEYD